MATPEVGKTHDVVIYGSAGNIPPLGLIAEPMTYRVTRAPMLVPRMAVGDPTGLDLSNYTSIVQEDWRGKSQALRGGTHDYYHACGMAPQRADGSFTTMTQAAVCSIYNNTSSLYWLNPGERVPYVQGIVQPSGSRDRILVGQFIVQPTFMGQQLALWYIRGSLLGELKAYDVVQYSGVAFATTYSVSGTTVDSYTPIQAFMGASGLSDTVWTPVGSTTGQYVAVYDGKLWRSEPNGHRIAYRDGSGWSDWISLDASVTIKGLEAFIGRLFIGTDAGLWAYEAGRCYEVVSTKASAYGTSFELLKAAHGSLWFNVGPRLMRYTSGGLLEEIQFDFGSMVPSSLVAGPSCVYVLATRGITDEGPSPTMYRIDLESGAVQQVMDFEAVALRGGSEQLLNVNQWGMGLALMAPEGGRSAALVAGPLQTTLTGQNNVSILGFGPVDEMVRGASRADLTKGANYKNNPELQYVQTTWFDAGYPALNKQWERLRLTMQYPFYAIVKIWYRTAPGGSFTELYSDTGTTGTSEVVLEQAFPSGTESKKLQLKIGFGFDALATRPIIRMLEVADLM